MNGMKTLLRNSAFLVTSLVSLFLGFQSTMQIDQFSLEKELKSHKKRLENIKKDLAESRIEDAKKTIELSIEQNSYVLKNLSNLNFFLSSTQVAELNKIEKEFNNEKVN